MKQQTLNLILLRSPRVVPVCTGTGYGIAFHKVPLYYRGGRPVIYTDKLALGLLPDQIKHLFVTYTPTSESDEYPVDFTWEREWRIVPRRPPAWPADRLELDIDNSAYSNASGALIVQRDEDVTVVQRKLEELRSLIRPSSDRRQNWRNNWPNRLRRVISLETVEREHQSDEQYARIDTWPEDAGEFK